jgi:uncharacterized membrane protein YhaH (DUF805 family)
MLFTSLRHATTNLANFRGRDNPALFWPFAGLVIGGVMALSMAGAMVLMAQMLPKMIAFAQAHPERTHVERGLTSVQVTIDGPMAPSPFDPALFRQFVDTTLAVNAIILVLVVVLLGAAVTRRLHDSAMPGVIAWIPVALMVAGMAQMRDMMPADGAAPIDLGTFFRAFATNMAYLISLGGLVYLLIRKGTPGENRYGAPR